MLQHAFPGAEIHRLYYGIDSKRFRYRAISKKPKKLSCLIKKNPVHNLAVYQMAQARAIQKYNRLGEFDWHIMKGGQPESVVADVMRDSIVFVFLSIEEGCPLMPIEAALSGAIPLVYGGGPLNEWLPDECRFEYGNVAGVVDAIEEIIEQWPDKRNRWAAIAEEASKRAAFYSLEREEERLIEVWNKILSVHG
jgi:glycosyltransferase involved in cell wall biosynthesis